jgi:HK97 family phage major capsid protein
MPTIQELREKRANIWDQMTEIMVRTQNDPSGEDRAKYDAAETELDEIGDKIERAERFADAQNRMSAVDRSGVVGPNGGTPEPDDEDAKYAASFGRFIRARHGTADLSDEDRRRVQGGFRTGDAFKNAAGVGTGAAGGYTVPPAFRDKIVQALLAYGPMLRLAETLETDSGVNIPWATSDDTGNEGAILAENTQISEQDVTLGTNSLDAYMYTSKLIRVSYQLMQDKPDFDTWLAARLGERLARIYNRHATVGTGSSQPDGIVTSATVGVTGTGSLASTGGFTYANLVDLVESVDDAYLQTINAGFMMHQTVRKALRKLLDGQNRPIWEPSLQAGQPDSLLGYAIHDQQPHAD